MKNIYLLVITFLLARFFILCQHHGCDEAKYLKYPKFIFFPNTINQLISPFSSSSSLIALSGAVDENDDSSSLGAADNGDGKSECGSLDSNSSRDDLSSPSASKIRRLSVNETATSISDRHVYKYRCNQCSQAFRTIEKLNLHSQYHLVRAATQCCLCQRNFRSLEALNRHFETSHQEMSEEELEIYRKSLSNNPMLLALRNGGSILDPATTELLKKESNRVDELTEDEAMDLVVGNNNTTSVNLVNSNNISEVLDAEDKSSNLDQAIDLKSGLASSSEDNSLLEDQLNSQSAAEDGYNDPNRKYKCHRCKVAFTRQSYLSSHNKTLLHRKGEKLSYPMEKYLDPNRPHKCDICKESFTQKTILQVHENSVLHLHKKKLAQKENNQSNDPTDYHSASIIASSNIVSSPSATGMTVSTVDSMPTSGGSVPNSMCSSNSLNLSNCPTMVVSSVNSVTSASSPSENQLKSAHNVSPRSFANLRPKMIADCRREARQERLNVGD